MLTAEKQLQHFGDSSLRVKGSYSTQAMQDWTRAVQQYVSQLGSKVAKQAPRFMHTESNFTVVYSISEDVNKYPETIL